MNTGLSDAENLAWKLALVATGRASADLLDTYEAERRPIATEVLSSTSAMTDAMLGRTAPARLLRDHVMVPLMNRPFVQRRITEASSQLKVTYRGGPLGVTHSRLRHGGQPGDRVPDLACSRADGTATYLHDELGGRWALLTDDPAAVRIAQARLGAGRVSVLRAVPRRQTTLVRPDAHLAFRGTPGQLDTWLSAALGRAPVTA